MKVIEARNVNDAYLKGLRLLKDQGLAQGSRAGEVLVMPCPVTTVYEWPLERVLFNSIRDANPFFHLGEALWMLAGRNDATWLDRFVKDFSSRFAEKDGQQHGAYGYRWLHHFDLEGGGYRSLPNQLDTVVRLLRANPDDRRVVLTMWDPVADLGIDRRDIPCNTHAYFRILNGALDITVCCRSNDAVWGAYGANAVHFSILQEYIATRIGVDVGLYFQISNNFHVYTDVLKKVWPEVWPSGDNTVWDKHRYERGRVEVQPLMDDPGSFDSELDIFLQRLGEDLAWRYENKFFSDVATPFFLAHNSWRNREYNQAQVWLEEMPENNDWRLAASEWMKRRLERMPTIHVGDLEGGDRGVE